METHSELNKVELTTQKLTKRFGELQALDEVSIEIKNCITLIIGPNGG